VPRIDCPVDGQDSIQMIDFVLEQFRKGAFGPECVAFPVHILIPDVHREAASHLDEEIGQAEAIIPQRHPLSAVSDNDGVDQSLHSVAVDDDNPLRRSYLRGRDAAAESMKRTEVIERVGEVPDKRRESGEAKGMDLCCAVTERGMSEAEDFADCHAVLLCFWPAVVRRRTLMNHTPVENPATRITRPIF
jgi:hypothetical protein